MSIVKCKECGGEVSTKAVACPKCGAKIVRTSGCAKVVLCFFLAILFLVLAAQCVPRADRVASSVATVSTPLPPKGESEAYPAPWLTDGPAFDEIAVTLGRSSIGGCGEFHYRLAKGEPDAGEALVYCTSDGRNWTHYLVFYNINKVMRIAAEPGVPYPTPLISSN